MDFESLKRAIREKDFSPVYLLHGDEPYFIDELVSLLEENVLEEHERDFNQSIFYGKDSTFEQVVSASQRFPMMAERQLIIFKEAQDCGDWRREEGRDYLQSYMEHAQPSTVLVIAHKYKKLAGNTKVFKSIKSAGEVFTSDKLYENKLPDWIRNKSAELGIAADPQVNMLLAEYLGADLGKVVHALEKLKFTVGSEHPITTADVEKYIGISKDFNVFELQNALAVKDHRKALQIIRYFAANPKEHPIYATVGFLFSFYTKLLQYHDLPDKTNRGIMSGLGLPFPAVESMKVAGANYSAQKVIQNISVLRELDRKLKGVEYVSTPNEDLQQQMVFDLMN